MIVQLLYRACRLLSFAVYEWLSSKVINHPSSLSGPTTQEGFTRQPIVGMLAHDPLKGPQIPNVFVITLAMLCLYLLLYSQFSSDYRIFLRGAWNLHDCSLSFSGSGSAVSNVAQGECICWDATQCSKHWVAN